MNVEIIPEAFNELRAATEFYAAKADANLARVFLAEFERAVKLIACSPNLGSAFNGRIVAVAHQRRRPGYWKKRN
jgi:toxin ParE1/3/4